MGKYQFKIFITGNTPQSEMAIANLHRMCEKYLANQWEIKVIDVIEQPHLAEEARIHTTPTLVKISPPPLRKVTGDLSDIEMVMAGLGLYHGQTRIEGGSAG
jgi:circadian clock protein KaiB